MKYILIIFSFLSYVVSFSQESNLMLVDFDFSNCVQTFPQETKILSENFSGDTLIITFVGLGNSMGFNSTTIRLSGDSLLLCARDGKLNIVPFDELTIKAKEFYLKQDTIPEFVEYTSYTNVSCAFMITARIIGLNSKKKFEFYFNQHGIKLLEPTEEYQIHKSIYGLFDLEEEVVEQDLLAILESRSNLKTIEMNCNLIIDPEIGRIAKVKRKKSWFFNRVEKKIISYFREHIPLSAANIGNYPVSNYYIHLNYSKHDGAVTVVVTAVMNFE